MQRTLLLCLVLVASTVLHAQWMENGNSGLNENTYFLGNTDNFGTSFRTHDIMRMRLYGSQSSTINGFTGVEQNGYLGISPQPLFFSNTVGPFTRLHLADSINDNTFTFAQPLGFRPWMKNGITFTGNSDQAYIGQRFYGNDSTDLVFQWSDNPGTGTYTPDR